MTKEENEGYTDMVVIPSKILQDYKVMVEETIRLQKTIEWYEMQLRELRAKVVSLEEKLKLPPQE